MMKITWFVSMIMSVIKYTVLKIRDIKKTTKKIYYARKGKVCLYSIIFIEYPIYTCNLHKTNFKT